MLRSVKEGLKIGEGMGGCEKWSPQQTLASIGCRTPNFLLWPCLCDYSRREKQKRHIRMDGLFVANEDDGSGSGSGQS